MATTQLEFRDRKSQMDTTQLPYESAQDSSSNSNANVPVAGGSLITDAVYRLRTQQTRARSVSPTRNDNVNTTVSEFPFSDGRQPLKSGSGLSRRPPGSTKPSHNSGNPARSGSVHEESADDTVLRLSNELEPVVEADWDTVIYIGPPPQEHMQDDHEYEYIKQHFAKPYLMNSQTLKDAGSAQFNKFLGPMSARAERKLKKLGIHQMLPSGQKAKYYIDLRPMQDEDEALLMITELTCSPGVLSWHLSHLASGVPKTIICGKDDLNFASNQRARSWIEIDDTAVDDTDETSGESKQEESMECAILDLEPEYSALRHYMAIERLLHAMSGANPKLNSAAKVWTYFAIAKFFDCATTTKVTSWIYDWLFASNNTNFAQANPEVAYRMAFGMRSPDLLRATFAILVGARALAQAGRLSSDPYESKQSTYPLCVHSRTISYLDDDEVNRVDHAAHSLTRRMTGLFHSIASGPLPLESAYTEMSKLGFLLEWYKNRAIVDEPYQLLQEYVRGEIFQALSQNLEEGDLMRLYRTKGFGEFGWLKRSKSFADAYNNMTLPQRLLTQSFWSQLENYGLYQELDKTAAWTRSHSLDGLDELAPDFQGEIACVSKHVLQHEVENMNCVIAQNKAWVKLTQDAWDGTNDPSAGDWDSEDNLQDKLPLPSPDQELVRAMQGLGMLDKTASYGFKPFHSGQYDQTYPCADIAAVHRAKGGPWMIKLAQLLSELSLIMRRQIMREILTPGYLSEEMGIESEISISQMDILLCLNDDEWKYLPLWAGGLDDGTGGVFAELDVPDMEAVEGFRGGRMGLGNIPGGIGSVGGSFSMADGSDFDEVMTDEGISTVGRASRIATDGTTAAGASTVMSLDE